MEVMRLTVQQIGTGLQVTCECWGYAVKGPQTPQNQFSAALRQIEALLQRAWLRQGGTQRDLEELRRITRPLATLLLGDEIIRVLSGTSGSSLTVTANSVGQLIPWETLVVGDTFLCERFTIGRQWLNPPPTHPTLSGRLQTLAIPDEQARWVSFDQRYLRLLFAEACDRFPEQFGREVRISPSVDQSAFWQAVDGSRWLHVGGHARLESGRRALQLSDGSLVTPDDVLRSPISSWPSFLFLQACGSAQIPDTEISLVKAFQQRGVNSVIGTLAPVLDEQSHQFIQPFYKALLQGETLGNAMRQARFHLREQLPPGNLLWLTYVLYGNPEERLMPTLPPQPNPARESMASQFPCQCHQCGRIIETRHGLARQTSSGPLCRPCDHDNPKSPSASNPTTDLGTSQSNDGHQAKGLFERFLARWDENVAQLHQIYDIASGSEIEVVMKPTAEPVTPHLTLSATDWRPLTTESPQHRTMRCYEVQARGHACDRTIIQVVQVQLGANESPRALVQLLERQSHMECHRIIVLVSHLPGENASTNYFTGDGPDARSDVKTHFVLISGPEFESIYRTTDLVLYPFLNLFQFHDGERRIQTVLEFLNNQLPLETSLSAASVALELRIPLATVETGFKLAARQFGLQLDQVPRHGLVLSELSVDQTATPLVQVSTVPSEAKRQSRWSGNTWMWLYIIAGEVIWGLVGLLTYLKTLRH